MVIYFMNLITCKVGDYVGLWTNLWSWERFYLFPNIIKYSGKIGYFPLDIKKIN